MISQNLALKQGKRVVGHNIQSWTGRRRRCQSISDNIDRCYGTERGLSSQLREELVREHVKDLSNKQKAKKDSKALDKDFFLSILSSSATKRDAKSYIQTYTTSQEPSLKPSNPSVADYKIQNSRGHGVNLGGFYGPAAVEESPQFVQQPDKQAKLPVKPQLHIALVKIRAPQLLNDETLNGIGKTLSQLGRLGLTSIVVVDCNSNDGPPLALDQREPDWRAVEVYQANRIIAAIDANGDAGARLVDNSIGISEKSTDSRFMPSETYVTLRRLLMTPLRRGIIPVIPSVGYTDVTQTALPVPASDVVLALIKELAGPPFESVPNEDLNFVHRSPQTLREEVLVDRLIVLDPLGGLPATDRPGGYHVFLNMEQEYESARENLCERTETLKSKNEASLIPGTSPVAGMGSSKPLSKFAEIEFSSFQPEPPGIPKTSQMPKPQNWNHLENLKLVRLVLSILPRSSSALLTTPEEASNSVKDAPFQPARVGTRRQRNPLIHNLLTDKPVFSSSLPAGRLGPQLCTTEPVSSSEIVTPTTFAKHGMSVTIFPDPKLIEWQPPFSGKAQLNLTDAQIDLPRLIHLIDDSFGRKLDVEDYLKRVDGRVAGVIIAGEYEGGAILTWETPPGLVDDGSSDSRARMVPYLDKFAVLKRSQGSGGVADLIFKAMVRDCFPNGVVWRSRKNNPVNKWYFERSRGTWKLPDTGWTMFWTTPELSMDKKLFLDYEGVCRAIEPSWADNKAILD